MFILSNLFSSKIASVIRSFFFLISHLKLYLRVLYQFSYQWRVPRLMWETSIFATTMLVRWVSSPILHLFLAIILGTTGLIDMFFWSPWFGLVAEFDECTGGFFSKRVCTPHFYSWEKGYGRLMVSLL